MDSRPYGSSLSAPVARVDPVLDVAGVYPKLYLNIVPPPTPNRFYVTWGWGGAFSYNPKGDHCVPYAVFGRGFQDQSSGRKVATQNAKKSCLY